MATTVHTAARGLGDERFFLVSAILMAALITAGFSVQVALGRSSFAAPWPVHAHALLFFAWVALYLLQNSLVATGRLEWHRQLGWAAALLVPAMVVAGIGVMALMVRAGTTPFFFTPAYFIVMNPLSILVFAGLVTAAVRLRRETAWHRRFMYCAMAVLLAPALGRLLPMPLFVPFSGLAVFTAVMLFPLAGATHDLRRTGRVHPAWLWGIGILIGLQVTAEVVGRSSAGAALARAVSRGGSAETIDPLRYPSRPALP